MRTNRNRTPRSDAREHRALQIIMGAAVGVDVGWHRSMQRLVDENDCGDCE